jgi:Ca-activated chloride channel family protein
MQRTRLFPYGCICSVLPGLLALALTSFCWGQADTLKNVHVSPRKTPEQSQPVFSTPADNKLATPFNEADRTLRSGARSFVKDVNLVLVPVTITDAWNRLVMGLHRDDFTLLENGKKQPIQYFSSQDAPISACVIFDTSASMKNKINLARKAVEQFVVNSNPQDEFCLITFSDHPNFVVGFGDPLETVLDKLALVEPVGRTALLDAIYMGVDELHRAHNPRKVLLIISDGEDNRSRYTAREITNIIMESDLQAYSIGVFEGWYPFTSPENTRGGHLLRTMAECTGGGSMIVTDKKELEDAARVLNLQMRNQYLLGYRPANDDRDGKWRDIEIRLNRPGDFPPVHIASKSGYYAPGR